MAAQVWAKSHGRYFTSPATLFCGSIGRLRERALAETTTSMSGEPRQRKLGSKSADGNWQLGSPTAANGDKTQTVTGYKRRAPTAATDAPFNAGNLQAAVRHNAAKEKDKDKAVEAKPAPSATYLDTLPIYPLYFPPDSSDETSERAASRSRSL